MCMICWEYQNGRLGLEKAKEVLQRQMAKNFGVDRFHKEQMLEMDDEELKQALQNTDCSYFRGENE